MSDDLVVLGRLCAKHDIEPEECMRFLQWIGRGSGDLTARIKMGTALLTDMSIYLIANSEVPMDPDLVLDESILADYDEEKTNPVEEATVELLDANGEVVLPAASKSFDLVPPPEPVEVEEVSSEPEVRFVTDPDEPEDEEADPIEYGYPGDQLDVSYDPTVDVAPVVHIEPDDEELDEHVEPPEGLVGEMASEPVVEDPPMAEDVPEEDRVYSVQPPSAATEPVDPWKKPASKNPTITAPDAARTRDGSTRRSR